MFDLLSRYLSHISHINIPQSTEVACMCGIKLLTISLHKLILLFLLCHLTDFEPQKLGRTHLLKSLTDGHQGEDKQISARKHCGGALVVGGRGV